MNKKLRSTALGACLAITGLAGTITPAYAQTVNPTDTRTLYMAPMGSCDDNNDGSQAKPLCTSKAVSTKLEKEYRSGGVRGDVEIRLVTNKGDFKVQPDGVRQLGSFTYAPAAGTTMRILPDWYTTDSAAAHVPNSQYPTLRGIEKGKEVSGSENGLAVNISPAINRGGTFEIAYLNIRDVVDGMLINGKMSSKDDNEISATMKNPLNGSRRGANAAISHPIVRNVHFTNIGDKYVNATKDSNGSKVRYTSNGNGALRFWNTDGLVFKDSSVTNFNNTTHTSALGHVLYGAYSANAVIENNTFSHTDSTVVHGRQTHNWVVKNNKFNDTHAAEISYWHRGEYHYDHQDGDKELYAECPGSPAKVSGSTLNGRSNSSLHHQSSGHTPREFCSDEKRVFAPTEVKAFQTGNKEYTYTWSPATTQNGSKKITGYEVFLGKDANNYTKINTLSADANGYTFTASDFDKAGIKPGSQFMMFVVGINNAGYSSPRTQTMLTGFLDKNVIHGSRVAVGGSMDYGKGMSKQSATDPRNGVKGNVVNSGSAAKPTATSALPAPTAKPTTKQTTEAKTSITDAPKKTVTPHSPVNVPSIPTTTSGKTDAPKTTSAQKTRTVSPRLNWNMMLPKFTVYNVPLPNITFKTPQYEAPKDTSSNPKQFSFLDLLKAILGRW